MGISIPGVNGAPPNKALLATSSPARTATAENITKLQQMTGTQPGQAGAPTPTSTTNGAGATGATATAAAAGPIDTTKTTSKDANADALKGVTDPALKEHYSAALANLDTQAQQAQSNIDSIGARSMNDPAVMNAVNLIKEKYGKQIELIKARSKQAMGKSSTAVAAFGGLGQMSQDFLDDQQTKWDGEVSSAQSRMDSLIFQAQAAYQTQNFKDLQAAMDSMDKVNKEKLDALGKLLDASDKAMTREQNQQRIDLTSARDAITHDATISSKMSAGIAANIKASGITDEKQIRGYVDSIAKQYGISNPDLLYSQVVAAQQDADKNDLSAQNIQSEMTSREESAKLGRANLSLSQQRLAIEKEKAQTDKDKQTAADKKEAAHVGIQQRLELNPATGKAYTFNDPILGPGTPYTVPARNGKQYLTAAGFNALLNASIDKGISRSEFIGQYKAYLQPGQAEAYGLSEKEIRDAGV